MNLSQIAGMMRYEVLMAWRRRSLGVLLALFIVTLTVFTLVSRDANVNSRLGVDGNTLEEFDEALLPDFMQGIDLSVYQGDSQVAVTMIASVVVSSIAVIMFMNEAIPLDRQYKMRELLDTCPITRTTYLTGKLLGTWLGLLIIMGISLIFGGVILRVLIGTYSLDYYLLMWGAFLLPTLLVCSGLTVLLTSWTGSRRGATLTSLLIMPIGIMLVSVAITSLSGVGVYVHPAYSVFILLQPDAEAVVIITDRIRSTLTLFAWMLALAWGFAYAWQRVREAR